MLQWARAQGCPWDEWTCAAAAGMGHMEVLHLFFNDAATIEI